MGRNGMGKTTLIRTLVGLVRPRSGMVLLDGEDVTRAADLRHRPARHRLRAGGPRHLRHPQRGGEPGDRRAGRDAAAGAVWTRARVLELFPRLAERLANRGDQLSGGEQQMLAIGRALLTNPRLLILDEATEGLAPIIRDEIWKTVALIRSTGMATLVVDKTVAAVTAIADRIVILVKGEVVFEGTPAELKADPDLMHRHLGV